MERHLQAGEAMGCAHAGPAVEEIGDERVMDELWMKAMKRISSLDYDLDI